MFRTAAISVNFLTGSDPGWAVRATTEVEAWPGKAGAALYAAGIGAKAAPTPRKVAKGAKRTTGTIDSATRIRLRCRARPGRRTRRRNWITAIPSSKVVTTSVKPTGSGLQGIGPIGMPTMGARGQVYITLPVPAAAIANNRRDGTKMMAAASPT